MGKWKKALSLLLISCILIANFTIGTFAADRPSVYELNTAFSVTVDGVDVDYYTIYASALAFAVGQTGEPVKYLVTDTQAVEVSSILSRVSDKILDLLKNEGLIVDASELADLVSVEASSFCIAYDGNWIPVKIAFAVEDSGILVMEIAEESDYISNASVAAFAADPKSGDAVTNFSLNATTDELYGVVEGDVDLVIHSIVAQNGSVTHVTTLNGENTAPAVMADITRSLGALGAPLLNSQNEVIAVTTYDVEKDVTLAAISDDTARQLSSMEIITSSIREETKKAETTANALTLTDDMEEDSDVAKLATIIRYAIIAAIGLVVILLILLIIRFRRSRHDEDELDEAEIEEQYEQRQREMRKKHRERHSQVLPKVESEESAAPLPNIRPAVRPQRPMQPAAEPAQEQEPAVQPVAAPAAAVAVEPEAKAEFVTLTVVNGKKKGYSMKSDGRIVIGRDPRTCKMLFPASDTTISRTHCVLTYLPTTGDIVLEDLNSANGTYSASGRRLIPGKKYRVRLGDKFYLGTEENMIEVK